ncbi:elongation factor G [Porphyromonadaceae bacterium OttesenSCG-928-L07]|nr:elongation factor G [Porphyromonadaceae bacterium OttesenSCG-928-L07]MDL2330807.1 elongation factor G [Odoribacter sp. OttesenSCG-928-A06]
MKTYSPNEIKNIALVGSAGSGKTTLAEAMMFEGGVIPRRGSVENKNTSSDYRPVEHEYGSSVFPAVLYAEWKEQKLNFIDTPGADDFVGGVVSALDVADTAVMVINTVKGVEVGTEIVSRYVKKKGKPMILLFNQLDHEKANFEQTLEQAKASFGSKAVLIQYPVNLGAEFNMVVDVLKMEMYKWKPEGGKPEVLPIPDSEKERANELHNALVEAAAENDEKLMELYFDKGSLTEDEMRFGIRAGLIKRDMFPIFCASAGKDMCVRRFMEFLVNVAPSAAAMPGTETVDGQMVPYDEKGPVSLFVFSTSIEPHLGDINYFKVMSGVVKESDDLINISSGNKERLSQLYAVAGKNRTKVTELKAGDIGATVKLKSTRNGDTLNEKDCNYKFPAITYPNSRFRTAVRAVNKNDEEKVAEVLNRMHEEDPSLLVEYSKELKQLILSGQGEYHLNTMKWRIENNDKVAIEFVAPKIPYRETITKYAQADYRHKKQSGGAGQFGEVHMVIEPYKEGMPDPTLYKIGGVDTKVSVKGKEEHTLPWGGKLIFYNCIVGGVIEARFMPAILKGIMEKLEEGPLTGSYARDIRVCVYDGKMHPVDSNEISFRLAGRHAFSEAFKKADPKIMEPVYDVEVLVPEEDMGDVMSDLQTRRAMIMGMDADSGFQKIKAKVPLKEMQRYSTALSSITGGRAAFSMEFAGYERVPSEVQEELLKAYKETEEED